MRRLLVIINHLELGGIQKSLLGYLKETSATADITLLVFSMQGALTEWLPANIRTVETCSLYHFFGMAQRDCKTPASKLLRTGMALAARLFGTSAVCAVANRTLDSLGDFDEIISYHHPGRDKTIYGGTAQYALAYAKRHPAKTSCFVHCDLHQPGLNSPRCIRIYTSFQQIVCVSEGTKARFLSAYAEAAPRHASGMEQKTIVKYNIVDTDMIHQLADSGTIPPALQKSSADERITLLSVSRISQEKGIFRFVRILAGMDVSRIRYVIVGSGKESAEVAAFIREHHLEDTVLLAGERLNPYPYMKHADMLVVPSYHEAAPVVFQEAAALSLPVFTTETLSAREMVKDGWIVENDDDAIRRKLEEVVSAWNRSGSRTAGGRQEAAAAFGIATNPRNAQAPDSARLLSHTDESIVHT